ncbi:MAG: 16S rRNA (cytidine(1402)-2'-O)-methyltransferase [Geminicoccaceae bacterium]
MPPRAPDLELTEPAPERKLAAGLYVVATPIGNLGDITRRASAILADADAVICEDSRVTSVLLRHLHIRRPMLAYHEHNAERMRPQLLERLAAGEALALVSDAGTPAISDPGFKLVREAVEKGIAVIPIPGPTALAAALVGAGLPTDRFFFQGFLPPRSAARRTILAELAPIRATLVFYEAPQRVAEMLADCAAVLGDRPAAVCRELTKLHEEFRRDRLQALASALAEREPRGEIVVVVGPPEEGIAELDPSQLDAALVEALETLRPRAAAARVAEATGRPVNELYARAIALKGHGA